MSNERQINVKPEHQNDVKKLVNLLLGHQIIYFTFSLIYFNYILKAIIYFNSWQLHIIYFTIFLPSIIYFKNISPPQRLNVPPLTKLDKDLDGAAASRS